MWQRMLLLPWFLPALTVFIVSLVIVSGLSLLRNVLPARISLPQRAALLQPMRGPVRSSDIYQAEIQQRFGENHILEQRRREALFFDSQGRLIRHDFYRNNRAIEARHLLSYDADGRINEVVVFNNSGDPQQRYLPIYDDSHTPARIHELRFENQRGVLTTYVQLSYDAQGRLHEERIYNPDQRLRGYVRYIYNDRGDQRGTYIYDAEGRLQQQWLERFAYDAWGNRLRSVRSELQDMFGTPSLVDTLVSIYVHELRLEASSLRGMWLGSYRCVQQDFDAQLELTPSGEGRLEAIFSFQPQDSGLEQRGSYRMQGSYYSDGTIRLQAQDWLQRPPGGHMVNMQGRVDVATLQMELSLQRWLCGTAQLRRLAAP